MKYFVIFLVLIGSSGLIIPQIFADSDYTQFIIDDYTITTNSNNVADISLNWDSKYLPEGTVTFSEPFTGPFEIQIPKNMPRTMNLDFETSLFLIVNSEVGSQYDDKIIETESECFYVLSMDLENVEYFEIVTGSVATGKWELVTIQNEECNAIYDDLIHNVDYMPLQTFISPLKQFKSGVSYDEIQCKDGLELVGKMPSADPKCVKPESVEELVMRGWATTNKTLELTNPMTYMVDKNEYTFEIQYSLKGATLESIAHDADANSVHVELNNAVGGQMIMSLPRDLLDAKIGINNVDDVFFLLIDGEENMYGEKIIDDERIITVWFPKGTHEIEIIGTFWI